MRTFITLFYVLHGFYMSYAIALELCLRDILVVRFLFPSYSTTFVRCICHDFILRVYGVSDNILSAIINNAMRLHCVASFIYGTAVHCSLPSFTARNIPRYLRCYTYAHFLPSAAFLSYVRMYGTSSYSSSFIAFCACVCTLGGNNKHMNVSLLHILFSEHATCVVIFRRMRCWLTWPGEHLFIER